MASCSVTGHHWNEHGNIFFTFTIEKIANLNEKCPDSSTIHVEHCQEIAFPPTGDAPANYSTQCSSAVNTLVHSWISSCCLWDRLAHLLIGVRSPWLQELWGGLLQSWEGSAAAAGGGGTQAARGHCLKSCGRPDRLRGKSIWGWPNAVKGHCSDTGGNVWGPAWAFLGKAQKQDCGRA